jgi:hypothetical protein
VWGVRLGDGRDWRRETYVDYELRGVLVGFWKEWWAGYTYLSSDVPVVFCRIRVEQLVRLIISLEQRHSSRLSLCRRS